MDDWRDFLIWWSLSIAAAATVVIGRLGMSLFRLSQDPPEDERAAKIWERRRRWLAYSELMALPSFATIAVSSVIYWKLDPIVSVLISMFLGGVGFALLLDAAQWLFRKRLGMDQSGASGGNSNVGGNQQEPT